ncbi:MAG: DUF302 domain-containing protein [Nitrososphaerales archaeon]
MTAIADYSRKRKIDYTIEAGGKVEETVDRLIKEFSSRGFGVLSNINVQKIIKEKLKEDIDSYVILDVCSPKHAKKAIDAHKGVGLILPCKVTVFQDHGKVWVSLYKPTEAINLLGYEDLNSLAAQVEDELKRAIDTLLS